MPQDVEHHVVYLWDSGTITKFLSAAYSANNDRRLYLEARLSIAEGAAVSTSQHLNLSRSDSNKSSEGDDADNGGLVSDDEAGSCSSSGRTLSESIKSAPGIEYTTQVDAFPSNYQQPSCFVTVQLDISNLPGINEHAFLRPVYRIPLETTPHEMSRMVLGDACERFRKSQPEMMLALKAQGKGLHMRSFIAFNDERDAYFSRDRHQNCRIAKISDLFLSRKAFRKNPEIPFIVKIEILNLAPEHHIMAYDTAHFTTHSQVYAYHRVATGPVRTNPLRKSKLRAGAAHSSDCKDDVQLKPMVFAHAIRYQRACPSPGPTIAFPCREINGLLIGDTRDADESPDEDEVIPDEKYSGIGSPEHIRAAIVSNMVEEANRFGTVNGIPVLPSLTFLPFVGEGVQRSVSPIHVAVTLVNSIKGNNTPVPMGVAVEVSDGKGTKEAICAALSGRLREFYTGRLSHAGLRMMDGEGKWRWELWVLPQKVESEERVVMHRLREGKLGLFLDGEMVEKGVRTLYMEAHMVDCE